MKKALQLAQQAYEENEIPIGAVVVFENQIIAKGYNQTEKLKDATA
ncbi:MAG: tRNA-specific adenosine deaminase, partial [Bacteroidetes bacterium]|nr:tRNA-specific adenosine deaminase [Bacteroidota bacterium]